ncbi:mechanosensitive ion channel [Suttonella sp. R2A3]|uniref:mechanosensitive ion channel domain-containing protein n=1 Tax=Suttonella sp. R2A3 TaxID=2908648 RepID=UPI001F1A70D7|nr:mechanosensitive ion channel domain-containing protein [Suttonella sp. R2A3]UJF23854.1 mechanosensitive ion channel [Suttonella sp. R2A3]
MTFFRLDLSKFCCLIMLFFAGLAMAQDNTQASPSSDQQAYSALADVLDNPEQRETLIKQLRELSDTPASSDQQSSSDASASEQASKPQENEGVSRLTDGTKAAVSTAVALPKRIAEESADVAEEVGSKLAQNWRALKQLFTGKDTRFQQVDWGYFAQALKNLLLVVVTALGVFHGLRFIARPLKRRLNIWVNRSQRYQPVVRRFLGILLVAVKDLVFIALAYLAATGVAMFFVGSQASMSTQASLFINAFVVVELIKIGLRVIFYPRYQELRFLPGDNATARYWYHWIATIVNIVGYGFLIAVPLVSQYLSLTLSQALGTVLALFAFVYGVIVVLRNRKRVRDSIITLRDHTQGALATFFLTILARVWHFLALLYFLTLLVAMLLRGEKALPYIMQGTLKTIVIIGAGLLISTVLTQIIGKRITIPHAWSQRIPGLERRINAYIPLFLRVIRFTLMVLVFFATLSAWDIIDLRAWFSSDSGQSLVSQVGNVLMILIVAALVWLFLSSLIEHRLNPSESGGKISARSETLLSLFKTALAIAIGAITLMMVLSEIGVNIGPLIAGAGVLGLAIGFGSQKLVQDIITGIFIQIENAMNAGDVVTVDGITGTAERISIRTVSIRDLSGTFHIIPFSNVTTVSNYMRGYGCHVGEYGIGYGDDIDLAVEQLEAAFEELAQGEHKRKILEPLNVAGVVALADSSVNIRVVIKTTPGDQWAVGRAYNRLVKIYFDRAGIEIPFPHTTLYFGMQKSGDTPAANIRMLHNDVKPLPSTQTKQGTKSDHEDPSEGIDTTTSSDTRQPDTDGAL